MLADALLQMQSSAARLVGGARLSGAEIGPVSRQVFAHTQTRRPRGRPCSTTPAARSKPLDDTPGGSAGAFSFVAGSSSGGTLAGCGRVWTGGKGYTNPDPGWRSANEYNLALAHMGRVRSACHSYSENPVLATMLLLSFAKTAKLSSFGLGCLAWGGRKTLRSSRGTSLAG